jgi:rubrerythrin
MGLFDRFKHVDEEREFGDEIKGFVWEGSDAQKRTNETIKRYEEKQERDRKFEEDMATVLPVYACYSCNEMWGVGPGDSKKCPSCGEWGSYHHHE